MKALVLAGGQGARLGSQTPKPLVEIGGRAMIDLVIAQLAKSGVDEFVVAAGFAMDRVRAHFAARTGPRVQVVDTGVDTGTGGRILRAKEHLRDGPFAIAYCDCLSDLDFAAMRARHRAAGRTLTVMAVQPRLPFGLMKLAGGLVESFDEKPKLTEHWVNGGTFIAEPALFDFIQGDAEMLGTQ